jgi:hypothetical protein
VFALALKMLSEFTATAVHSPSLAYWDPQWRRDRAPLLDELAACVDHVHAYAKGGAHDITNFATLCARCNARKSTRTREEHLTAHPTWKVKGKHGEPTSWDGLSSVFIALARQSTRPLTTTERYWLKELERRAITREQ